MSSLIRFLRQIGTPSHQASLLGHSQDAAITATGTAIGTAYALTSTLNRVTTATAGVADGVRLPPIAQVKCIPIVVFNNTAGDTIQVYPGSGENLNGDVADAPVALLGKGTAIFWPLTTSGWGGGQV